MRFFSSMQLESLFQQAELSPRKRTNLNLHTSFNDKVQRLYIAMIKGSYVEPHYHVLAHQWEMFLVLQGEIHLKLYNADGTVKESILVGDGCDIQSIELHPYDIHSVECMSDRALLVEIKEGPFKPEFAKVFPKW
ncbi:cupin fold metalloprotein, WbuC family [Shewanella morhuae]|uniref:WbuC family cupin fold metalloprotein n=1 Tax=Shewanella morhuae TaxID=365591 RepID=UPI0009543501|nr:WbuC family cupin fold metalloprotein [Shewanella morhuae]SIR11026.1 cupin fold metalloprotein, WbuC family [Shewanella morhuae]